MDKSRNIVGSIIFVIIILFFIIGGYVFMRYMTSDSVINGKDKSNNENSENVRIDAKKDYIYFENPVALTNDIVKQDVVFNFKGLEDLNNTLKNEVASFENTIAKVNNETELPEGITCDNDYYSFTYRDYVNTEFLDYISLVVQDYNYNCVNGSTPKNIKAYVVNKKTGKLYNEEELLKEFNITEDMVIDKIKTRLDFTQTLDEDETQVINVDETISSIRNNDYGTVKALSIGKTGKLTINFIVKSNKINYNDSIELN